MKNVMLVGFGPIAQKAANYLLKSQHRLVSVVDINPQFSGRPVEDSTLIVESDLQLAIEQTKPDVALVCTVSQFDRLTPTLRVLANNSIHVVSSCEEMFFPFKRYPKLSAEIDDLAIKNNVSMLGTGINPGFLMDALPIFFTATSSKVDHILIERIQNASTRRKPFQEKIGAGLSAKEFYKKVESGIFGHVGLEESVDFILNNIGWDCPHRKETIQPIGPDDKGVGIEQVLIARDENNNEKLRLVFRASMNEQQPRDRICITGTPNIDMKISPPVHGDESTIAILVNCIDSVVNANPGLKTMADIPLPHFR